MQLRRLDVENIRSYERDGLDLAAGTTLVVGDVGAGKSSLLYAIEMALFGVAEIDAAYLVRHGASHAVVRVRFEDAEHAYEIERRFRRLRRKGRETFESERISFRVDGAATTYTPTEIRHRVIELLGFPDNPNPQAHSDLWRWAIYVPQEQMREILAAKPQERLETIRKALGVERFRIAAVNAEDLAADLRAGARHRREAAERLAYHDREFLEATAAVARLEEERAAIGPRIEEHTKALATARTDAEALRHRIHELAAQQRELDGLRGEDQRDERTLAERQRAAAERRRELERLAREAADATASAARLGQLEGDLRALEQAVREARLELEGRQSSVRELAAARASVTAAVRGRDDAAAAEDRAARAEEVARRAADSAAAEGPTHEPPSPTAHTLGDLDVRLEAARAEERTAGDDAVRYRHELAEVDELLRGGQCPRCGQLVDPAAFEPHRIEAAAAVAGADDRRATAEATRSQLEAERRSRERYERAHDRWLEVEKRRADLRSALVARTAEHAAATAARRAAEERLATDEARRAALAPAEAEVERWSATVAAREGELTAVRAALEHAREAGARAKGLATSIEALSAELVRSADDISAIGQRRTERQTRIAELRSALDAGALASREAEEGERRLREVEQALAADRATLVRLETQADGEQRRRAAADRGRAERATLFAEATEHDRRASWVHGALRERLLTMEAELLAHAQADFERHFVRCFASLVDDPGLVARTGVSFTPEVLIDGEATPPEALSGGERTALALAFRLALAAVVRSLGGVRLESLLLDEPTDGFSSEQVLRMGELLGTLALPQVVIVSHEAQLAAIADRTVRVVKRDGRATLDPDPRSMGAGVPGRSAVNSPELVPTSRPPAPDPAR